MKRILFSILGLVALLLISRDGFLMGDTSGNLDEAFDESIFAYHSPIAPHAGQSVTFVAEANHVDGIKKIRFVVTKRPLSVDANGNMVYGNPTSYDSDTTGHSCTFTQPYPPSARCEYPFNNSSRWIETDSYVSYNAILLDGKNNIHRDRKIGADIKIVSPAIKEARGYALPIYRRGKKDEKFNIVFVCDQSVATKADCHDLVDKMVATGYFKNPPPTHLKRYRRFFNLYLNDWSKQATETYKNPGGSGCSGNNINDLVESIPNIENLSWPDAWIVVHEPPGQDCSISGVSTAGDKDAVVHETMYSLFHRVNNSASLSAEDHSQILDYIGDGNLSAFSKQLPIGNENEEDDAEEEVSEKSQKTLVLSLQFKPAAISVVKKKIISGPAPHIFFPQIKRDFLISLLDQQEVPFKSFWIQDPASLITSYLRIPYYSQLFTIEIKDRNGKIVLKENLFEKEPAKKK